MAGPIRIAILANGRQARAEALRTSSSYNRMGKSITRAGRGLASVFAVAQLARGAIAIGKVGASYVDSLNKIQALTGSTDRQMGRVADRIESQSSVYARFGQTTGDAAAGMVELTKSGLTAQKALSAIRGTMTLAKAGELEVADASTLVANTLNTFSLKASKASAIANGLANAANISSADVSDLAESFKYAAPLAAKAGVSLAQTNAILAELSNSGVKASQAGTSLRGILLALQAPSTAGGMWLQELGVKVYGTNGKMRDFGDVIENLRRSLGELSQEDQNFALKSIFGRNSITGAQILIKGGKAALDEYTKGVQRAGAAQKLAASASRGLAGTILSIKAQATSAAQSFYRQYSPAIDNVLRRAVELAAKYKKILIPALAGAGVAMAGFAVAVGVVSLLTSPVLLLGGAVAGLGAATVVAYRRSEGFRNAVQATGDVIQTRVIPAVRSFGSYMIGTFVPAATKTAQAMAQRLQPILNQAGETFRNDLRPAIAQVDHKFREWQPAIKKTVEAVARLSGKGLVLGAAIAGKVVPPLIKLGGLLARTNIPVSLRLAEALARVTIASIRFGAAVIQAGQKAARFAAAVRAKFNEAVAFMASIPGRAKAALGSLGGLLFSAGSELIGGFISGITSRIGDVQGTLQGLTGKLTSWKGPPTKDAELLRPAGRLLMKGLVRGIDDGVDGVRTVLGRVTVLIQRALDGKKQAGRRKALLKSLKDEYAQLIKNGKAQDKIAHQLDKARDRYKDLVSRARDYAASVKAAFQSYGSVVGLGTTGGGTDVTLSALLSQLDARAAAAEQYAAIIDKLRGKLNKTSLQQLIDAGVDGGLATAQAIASGGSAAIAQINALTAQITAAGGKLGQSTSQTLYGAGIRAAEGIVKGLEKRQKKLDKVAERFANTLVKQVKHQLGQSVQTHARTTTATPRVTALDSYMSQRAAAVADQPVTVRVRFSAAEVSQLQRGKEIQADLDVYRAAGGRSKVKAS